MLRIISVDDTRLATWDSGEGDPWLFVHGFPLDHSMWKFQLDHAPRGVRMIAPDLRGFGRSQRCHDERLTMARFADDLHVLLREMGVTQPVTLCGLSMGGYIAFEFWDRYPEQLKRLVLCDTRAAADDETTRKARELTALRVLKEGTEFLADTMVEKLFSAATRQRHPYRVQALRDVMRRADPASVAAALRGMAERRDFSERLAAIDVTTTVICGAEDAVTPPDEMRVMAEQMPRAQFHLVAEAGHLAPYEQPNQVQPLLFGTT